LGKFIEGFKMEVDIDISPYEAIMNGTYILHPFMPSSSLNLLTVFSILY
jgi:hypothetical protein